MSTPEALDAGVESGREAFDNTGVWLSWIRAYEGKYAIRFFLPPEAHMDIDRTMQRPQSVERQGWILGWDERREEMSDG